MQLRVGELIILKNEFGLIPDFVVQVLEADSSRIILGPYMGNRGLLPWCTSLDWVQNNYREPTEKELEYFQMRFLSDTL